MLGDEIESEWKMSLGEGHTPLEQGDNLYLKREDKNPTGSVKDRGVAYQISYLLSRGVTSFVLPSSGNGAISAANYCRKAGVKFTAVISPDIDKTKLVDLYESGAEVLTDTQPTKFAHRYAAEVGAVNLRPSIDEKGSMGFRTIAAELYEQLGQVPGAIFFPVSSGTTLVGVYEGFDYLNQGKAKMFAVQSSAVHPISGKFDSTYIQEEKSLASGIVARAVPRKSQVWEIIEETQGGGVIVDNQAIKNAYDWLHGHGVNSSYDGAVSVAGAWKTLSHVAIDGPIVCLITGRERG